MQFAEVPKWRIDRDTFLKYSKRFRDGLEQPENYTCVGHAIVDFLRLGSITYEFFGATCDIEHSDKAMDAEKHRQDIQSNLNDTDLKNDIDLKCTVNKHLIRLKDMLASDHSFADLIVKFPQRQITNVLFYSYDGNEREFGFETMDAFFVLTFMTS